MQVITADDLYIYILLNSRHTHVQYVHKEQNNTVSDELISVRGTSGEKNNIRLRDNFAEPCKTW